MNDLKRLMDMIDEKNYPYFEIEYLQDRLDGAKNINALARELCLTKAGIEPLEIGDLKIPSPREYFLSLAAQYRTNQTGTAVRADEHKIL